MPEIYGAVSQKQIRKRSFDAHLRRDLPDLECLHPGQDDDEEISRDCATMCDDRHWKVVKPHLDTREGSERLTLSKLIWGESNAFPASVERENRRGRHTIDLAILFCWGRYRIFILERAAAVYESLQQPYSGK